MMRILVGKLLRDVRIGLLLVSLLLAAFQVLWARVTQRIADSGQILDSLRKFGLSIENIRATVFQGPGQIIQAIMGGENIRIDHAVDMISISYVHPLTMFILSTWAIGRASGAIAGEIDRGTMELLLAQPIRRGQVVLGHLCVDMCTIPVLCLSMWAGTWLGVCLVGFIGNANETLAVDPWVFGPGLVSVALLVFAISGLTMWLSSAGRFRWRVLGMAVVVALAQFLVNLIGQLWEPAAPLRPLTVYYYYQPQPIILETDWYEQGHVWLRMGVLAAVGAVGYGMALWTFCRRDLPAPL
ncbi:MAG TPA: ABC transporter permease subunit [Gemmataceae bacterium]|jgi:ABC-2 type transport system permease protein|nr:ABC transporter permease subunit [Gemmataceae bacterium]